MASVHWIDILASKYWKFFNSKPAENMLVGGLERYFAAALPTSREPS